MSTKEDVTNKSDLKVIFTDTVHDDEALFSVITARCNDQWVFCRHKDRNTYEVPGGHIESGESPDETAARELFEETGAVDFKLHRVCTYGVERNGKTNYGVLYFAEIETFGDLPDMEIGEVILRENLPENLTYPHIQPYLFEYVNNWLAKPKYKAVLFDLDGTLFDNFGAMYKALRKMYDNHEEFHKLGYDRFEILYENIQDKYFRMYQEKRLNWKEQRILRMQGLFSHASKSLSDEEAYAKFEEYLRLYESYWQLLDNAYMLLESLKSAGYKLGIVTNGEITQQNQKLQIQDIYRFFDSIVASSQYDFAKPQKEIFDIALNELGVKNSDALFVGDSMRSDICGAHNAEMDSVFIVREHNAHYSIDCEPTYTITDLAEILKIIGIKGK